MDYYWTYQNKLRKHRHRRFRILLSWLLNPPPGMIYRPTMILGWKRTLGCARELRYIGPFVGKDSFDYLRPFQHAAITLKMKGVDNAKIAEKLKVKESTVRTYFGEIRSSIKLTAGVTITSDNELIDHYKKYAKIYKEASDRAFRRRS